MTANHSAPAWKPPTSKFPAWMLIPAGLFALAVIAAVIPKRQEQPAAAPVGSTNAAPEKSVAEPEPTPSQVLTEMRFLLERKYFASPKTVEWNTRRMLEHAGNFWLGYFEVDAQNRFGVPLRLNLCAIIEMRPGETGIRFNPTRWVDDKCNPDNAARLAAFKVVAGWGKPIPVAKDSAK